MKIDKIGILASILTIVPLLLAASALRAQTADGFEQSIASQTPGGAFALAKTVVAGGAETQHDGCETQGTSGQPAAGGTSTGGRFSLNAGFWTPDAAAPTAAAVSVGGRVLSARGIGIRHARVTVQLPSGEIRTTVTGSLGYYRFEDLEVGAAYVLQVSSRRFVFPRPAQVLIVDEERCDIDFVAAEN